MPERTTILFVDDERQFRESWHRLLTGKGYEVITAESGKLALNIGNVYYSEPDEKRRTTANLSMLNWLLLNEIEELRFMGTIYWQKTTSRDGAVLFGSYPYPTNFMISNAVEPIHVFRKTGKRSVTPDIKARTVKVKPAFFFLRFSQPYRSLNFGL